MQIIMSNIFPKAAVRTVILFHDPFSDCKYTNKIIKDVAWILVSTKQHPFKGLRSYFKFNDDVITTSMFNTIQ